ncbi:DNA N-6-adenine-methyltransferase [Blastococcus sp. VKM Ac-2987]|uniref:DNA N-6-adenine-methyltransferase n=1 Tax=Blastococcus sp. VKM Ac-2987 TaxID=3004141 RepID=UPI0022AB5D77|nr:DNA N-6-adenine-methyltransferase [Blastococcus sp. VKM Ac-2987]MCZ2859187.1 DNA N-6-adenine-methyltransferase [Blastococcus sp. VKM Ac-2987]
MPRRRTCLACKRPLAHPDTGRPRTYCSLSCRQRLYRKRRKQQQRDEASLLAQLWATPVALRALVWAAFPHITLDVAATRDTALTELYIGPDQTDPLLQDALSPEVDWAELAAGGACWMNCPYRRDLLPRFLAKAVATAAHCDVVGLIPCKPTERWWITWVRDTGARWEAIPGRVAFDHPDGTPGRSAPMGVALVHWPARIGELPHGGETRLLGVAAGQ